MEKVTSIQLQVVPKPDPREFTILQWPDDRVQPLVTGDGDTNLLCGTCHNIICDHVFQDTVNNIYFQCSKCGSYNHARGTPCRSTE